MKPHFRYLWYVVRHKVFVLRAAWSLGIPWLGLLHDLSKFSPDEWEPYARFFYSGPHRARADYSAYEKTWHWGTIDRECKETVQERFDYAWCLHQKRNKHHWQFYLVPQDDGGTKVLEMPECYRLEMLADWIGAGLAQGKPDTMAWYVANKDKMQLHPRTRILLENDLIVHTPVRSRVPVTKEVTA